jgi:hypothetical protein
MYKIYSTYFLESDVEQYNCYVNETLWKRLTNELMVNRIFIRLNNNGKFWICSLGHPISTTFDSANHIYVPKWMLEQIDLNGVGEELEVDIFPSDVFDHSTKITLQPYTSIAHIESIQDILSYEFTKLGVLKKGSTIVVNMPEEMKFEVIELEPASVVLCEGDEVLLEFVESLESLPRPPTPYPFESTPTLLEPSAPFVEPSAPFVEPSAPVIEPSAPTLGGVRHETRYNPWRDKGFKPNSS